MPTCAGQTSRFANLLRALGVGQGRPRVLAARPDARAVRRGAGHAEERQRVLPAVPRLRAGADPGAAADRRREGAGDDARAVPAQDRADPRQPARARARADRRRAARRPRRSGWREALAGGGRRVRDPGRPTRKTWRCCTSPAARRASPRAPCTCTRPSWRTTPPRRSRSTCSPDDVFWCTADPGWVTGTSYGIIAPLTLGLTWSSDAAEFDARRWYQMLADHKVTVWYTAPTAIRMLMRYGPDLPGVLRPVRAAVHRQRRRAAEPRGRGLGPASARPADPRQLVADGDRRDHDQQLRGDGHQAGLDGPAAARCHRGAAGARRGRPGQGRPAGRSPRSPTADAEGELALRPGWPSMFRGYLHDEERYAEAFADGWYLTGDVARRDDDGYYWFVARADDVIKSAGHLIGPFEVESVLMEHPAVAEAGVIGKPDPVAGELVKAFVALKPGYEPERGTAPRPDRVRQAPARRGRAQGGRVRPGPAADPERQGHAPRAQGQGAGPGYRRRLHPGADAMNRASGQPARSRRGRRADRAPQRAAPPDAAHQAVRGEVRRAVQRGRDPRLRPPVHRRGGRRGRREPGATPADTIVSTYREHGHALVRGIPLDAVMAEMYGKTTGCSHGRGGSMHLFDASRRFYGGNAIVGGGLPLAVGLALADQMRGEIACHRLLLRRRRGRRRRVPRVHEPGRAVGAAGAVLLREQPVRDGHGDGARAGADRPGRAGAAATGCPRGRWTGWTSSPSSEPRAGPRRRSGRAAARTSSSCAPTGSAPIPCTTRSSTGTRPRWSSGGNATRSTLLARRMREAGELSDEDARGDRGRRSPRRSRNRPRRRGAAPAEPVEDLTRFVYSPESS